MPAIVGDDHAGAGGARHFSDVRVVDASPGRQVASGGCAASAADRPPAGRARRSARRPRLRAGEARPPGSVGTPAGRRVATEKNSRQQCQAVAGSFAIFSATACIPTARGRSGDRSRPAPPAARWCRGTGLRPPVTFLLDQRRHIEHRPGSAVTVGRATKRLPIRTSRGPGATRSRRTPVSSSVISSSVPGTSAARSRIPAGITTRPALSMVLRMALEYHRAGSDPAASQARPRSEVGDRPARGRWCRFPPGPRREWRATARAWLAST